MSLKCIKSIAIILCSVALNACGGVLPLVEGNAVYIAGPDGKKPTAALEELSKVDLVDELDPLHLGCKDDVGLVPRHVNYET